MDVGVAAGGGTGAPGVEEVDGALPGTPRRTGEAVQVPASQRVGCAVWLLWVGGVPRTQKDPQAPPPSRRRQAPTPGGIHRRTTCSNTAEGVPGVEPGLLVADPAKKLVGDVVRLRRREDEREDELRRHSPSEDKGLRPSRIAATFARKRSTRSA